MDNEDKVLRLLEKGKDAVEDPRVDAVIVRLLDEFEFGVTALLLLTLDTKELNVGTNVKELDAIDDGRELIGLVEVVIEDVVGDLVDDGVIVVKECVDGDGERVDVVNDDVRKLELVEDVLVDEVDEDVGRGWTSLISNRQFGLQ